MDQHIPEDAADARHDTPPEQKHNPFGLEFSDTVDSSIAWLKRVASKSWSPQAWSHVKIVLDELERLRTPVEFPGGYDPSAPWTDEDQESVRRAMWCVEAPDAVCHWPTVAGWLYAEVRRLRGDEDLPDHNRTWNLSVEQAESFIRECEARAQVATKLGAAHVVLLEELERLRDETANVPAFARGATAAEPMPPGLFYSYADGNGCDPAEPGTEEFTDMSVLELRVLSAHLSTALDNVATALREKGAGA